MKKFSFNYGYCVINELFAISFDYQPEGFSYEGWGTSFTRSHEITLNLSLFRYWVKVEIVLGKITKDESFGGRP